MLTRVAKHLVRSSFRTTVARWGVRLVDSLSDSRASLLRVLTYHRIDHVASRPDLDPALISATPEQFARQVEWLSKDFDLVSIDEVLAAVCGGAALPQRAVLLTFDDAYRDFAIHAWPVLQRWSAPAALFVATAYPAEPTRAFWWDRLYCGVVLSQHAKRIETPFGVSALSNQASRKMHFRELKQRLKSLPDFELQRAIDSICEQSEAPTPEPAVMDWDQLGRLEKEGVAMVPHTHTHPLLDRIPPEVARGEIRRSRDELHRRFGAARPVFAYPSGHFDERVASILRQEGFQLAFSTMRGINDLRAFDPLIMRRSNVARSTPDSLIRLQLTGAARFANRRTPLRFAQPLPDAIERVQKSPAASGSRS